MKDTKYYESLIRRLRRGIYLDYYDTPKEDQARRIIGRAKKKCCRDWRARHDAIRTRALEVYFM